jgi:hypothetical protein
VNEPEQRAEISIAPAGEHRADASRQSGLDEMQEERREALQRLRQYGRDRSRQPRRSLAHSNAALKKKAADLIDYRRALTDKAAAHTMQRLQIELVAPLQCVGCSSASAMASASR